MPNRGDLVPFADGNDLHALMCRGVRQRRPHGHREMGSGPWAGVARVVFEGKGARAGASVANLEVRSREKD